MMRFLIVGAVIILCMLTLFIQNNNNSGGSSKSPQSQLATLPSPSSFSSSSLLFPHDVRFSSSSRLKSLNRDLDWARLRKVIACDKQLHRGMFWDRDKKRCRIFSRDWLPESLLSFETSRDEFACHPESEMEQKHKNASQPWLAFAFKEEDGVTPENVLGGRVFKHFEVADDDATNRSAALSDDNSARLSLPPQWRDRYSRFFFLSSWLFSTWRPWRPNPVATNKTWGAGNVVPNSFRARHSSDDDNDENLFRLSNFCLSPFGGISGYYPAATQTYKGSEDTRSYYHRLRGLPYLIDNFERRPIADPPDFLDARPVVFFPVPAQSRWNIAHTLLQFMSLLGLLMSEEKKRGLLFGKNNSSSSSSSSNFVNLQPLIVLVYDPHWDSSLEFNRTGVLGFFFRLLDLPYAAVVPPASLTAKVKEAEHMKRLFKMTKHAYYSASTVESSDGKKSEVCFAAGVVWQNCFQPRCDLKDPEAESESYSFGMWTRPNAFRNAMVADFRRRLTSCMMKTIAPAAATTTTTNLLLLPRIFFDLRTGATRTPLSKLRSLRSFGVFFSEIRDALISGGYASDVVALEPWRGSRYRYVEEMRRANILIGVHGGAFAQSSMLPEKSVVIELTVPHFMVHRSRPDSWFGIYTRAAAVKADHWFFDLMNTSFVGMRRQRDDDVEDGDDQQEEEEEVNNITEQQQQESPPRRKKPDLRWSSRGIGLKDKFSVAPQFLIDVLKAASCRWQRRQRKKEKEKEQQEGQGSEQQHQQQQCRPSVIQPICARITSAASNTAAESATAAASSSSRRTQQIDCLRRRTLHHVINEPLYAGSFVRSIFSAFFGASAISAEESEALASRILGALDKALRRLAEIKNPDLFSGDGGDGSSFSSAAPASGKIINKFDARSQLSPFLEFDAHTAIRLRSSGAARFSVIWSLLVNHLGGWDGDVDVRTTRTKSSNNSNNSSSASHQDYDDDDDESHHLGDPSSPDVCLVVGGARRSCLYIAVVAPGQ